MIVLGGPPGDLLVSRTSGAPCISYDLFESMSRGRPAAALEESDPEGLK